MKIVSIAEVQRLGISKIIRMSEEGGIVFITSNDKPVAFITPLTLSGMLSYQDNIRKIITEDKELINKLNDNEKSILVDVMNGIFEKIDFANRNQKLL